MIFNPPEQAADGQQSQPLIVAVSPYRAMDLLSARSTLEEQR